MAFDYQEEARPSIIEISSNRTVAVLEQQVTITKEKECREETQKIERPEVETAPIKTTTWQATKNGPTRILERKGVSTKRFGIDVMKVDAEELGGESRKVQ